MDWRPGPCQTPTLLPARPPARLLCSVCSLQALLRNPELMRTMLQANPAVRQMVEANPEASKQSKHAGLGWVLLPPIAEG